MGISTATVICNLASLEDAQAYTRHIADSGVYGLYQATKADLAAVVCFEIDLFEVNGDELIEEDTAYLHKHGVEGFSFSVRRANLLDTINSLNK